MNFVLTLLSLLLLANPMPVSTNQAETWQDYPDDRVEQWERYAEVVKWDPWITEVIWDSNAQRWIIGFIVAPNIRWIDYPDTAPEWWQEFIAEHPYYGESTAPHVHRNTKKMTWDAKVGTWIERCSLPCEKTEETIDIVSQPLGRQIKTII